MKIFNKFVESKTAPLNKKDIWFDGDVFRIYKEEEWQPITVDIETALNLQNDINEALRNFQKKLTPGKGIIIENDTISTSTLFHTVEELPTEGIEDVIYLVLSKDKEDNNIFKEYTWINSTWEELGDFKPEVDLSFITEDIANLNEEVTTLKNKKADSAFSLESENPVMNKILTARFNELKSEVGGVQTGLNTKADFNGNYPKMSVGIAEDLMGRPFTVDTEFLFRPTAGAENEIKDNFAHIESIKGNSVVWNSKLDFSSYTNDSVDTRSLLLRLVWYNTTDSTFTSDPGLWDIGVQAKTTLNHITVVPQNYNAIRVKHNGATRDINIIWDKPVVSGHKYCVTMYFDSIDTTVVGGLIVNNIGLYDLTQMFGEGKEPTTIEEFYARIPQNIDLYAYNEGEVIHNNTDAIKSVGRNIWDEELELGIIGRDDNGDIIKTTSSTQLRSKNWIKVLPNTTYNAFCNKADFGGFFVLGFAETDGKNGSQLLSRSGGSSFTTKADTNYILFSMAAAYGTTYNHDICINLSDSSFNGQYEPYISREQSLDIIGKYFPNGMRSAGTAHDEIRYNKTTQKWEAVKKIGKVDLGTLGWSVDGNRFRAAVEGAASAENTAISNIICSKYNSVSPYDTYLGKTGISSNTLKHYIFIADSSFTEASALKSSLQGVIAYYELAEPVVTEITEEINLDYEVWNGGTEQAIADTPSTPLRAVIEYDFNANETIRQNKADINKIKRALQELKFDFMLPVTYSELVGMRDRGEFVAGMQYRITDYVTTTIQANTQSAGHAFDVIVLALSESELSEEAFAAIHKGDTYFTEAGANLSAWKVWYCLDNDSTRFAWAAPTDGYLRNVTITKYGYTGAAKRTPSQDYALNNKSYYAWTLQGGPSATVWFDTETPSPDSKGYGSDGTESADTYSVTITEVNKGKGVIYKMSDEWQNICPYDFKNIMFTHPHDSETYPNFYFTFNSNAINQDVSLVDSKCRGNVIERLLDLNHTQVLNFIVIFSEFSAITDNSFGADCSNIFGVDCDANSIGAKCTNISFGENCHNISLEANCRGISFGDQCSNISLGQNCMYVNVQTSEGTPSNFCRGLSFGNYVQGLTIVNDETESYGQQVQNIRVANGASGTITVQRNLPARDWVVGFDENETLTIKAMI